MIIHLCNFDGVLIVSRGENECDKCFSDCLGQLLESIHPVNCFEC